MKVPVQIMTEDDTFDRLRRPPIREMLGLWRDSPIQNWECEVAHQFFKSHGWNQQEFEDAWREYNGISWRDI